MTIDPQLAVPFAIAALFAVLGIAAAITTLALDRARRAEDRASLYQALLDKHRIPYHQRKETP